MMDIIVGINTIIDTVKKIKEVNDKLNSAEVKMLIADLSIQLAESKIAIAELLDENSRLKTVIKKREEEKETEQLLFKGGAYYDKRDDGPFCPACYDKSRQKVRLVENHFVPEDLGNMKCSVCNKMFHVSEAEGSR
jgi:hypothetical protein